MVDFDGLAQHLALDALNDGFDDAHCGSIKTDNKWECEQGFAAGVGASLPDKKQNPAHFQLRTFADADN